jgi:hypothetical protein
VGLDEFINYCAELEKQLFWLSTFELGYNAFGPTTSPNIKIGEKKIITQNSLLIPDFLIETKTWKISRLKCFFLFYKKIYPINKVIECNKKENQFIFGV